MRVADAAWRRTVRGEESAIGARLATGLYRIQN